MKALRKCLPNATETRFAKTLGLGDAPISGAMEAIGDSPEAFRGFHLGLECAYMIAGGIMAGARAAGADEDIIASLGAATQAILTMRVQLAEHPYTEEALALLEGTHVHDNQDD